MFQVKVHGFRLSCVECQFLF